MRVRACAAQLSARFGEVEENLDHLDEALGRLEEKLDLIVTPELYTTGYDLAGLEEHGRELAESLDGPSVKRVAELSRGQRATVVLGMLERGEDGLLYDSAVVIGPDGTVQPYRKTHLYPPERRHLAAGDRLLSVPTSAGRLGLMICFEHAFPEVATTLALEGAQILAVPSAVPEGYEHLLHLRTRARSQDNQIFAVAANMTGGEFCGRSLITDPRGEVLTEAGADEDLLVAVLDLEAIQEERKREPALRMRRPELY